MNKIIVWFSSKLRSLNCTKHKILGIDVGHNVFISWSAKIDTVYRGSITLGDGSFISNGAKIMAHDHAVYNIHGRENDNGRGKVVIGKNVVVGINAIILRNTVIGENAIIAAGAVVTKDVPPNTIVAGNPGRIINTFIPVKKIQANQ